MVVHRRVIARLSQRPEHSLGFRIIKTPRERGSPVVCLCFAAMMLLTVAGRIEAQESRIQGTVRDVSGAVVPGAEVRVHTESYSATTSTDLSGQFTFEAVPAASGTILVTSKGFEQVQQSWSTIPPASVLHLDIVLKPLPLKEHLVITAARTETRLSESPLSIVDLTQNDLQTTPALAIDDALRQVPGFSLFRRSGSRTANPSTLGVSLRGLGGTATSRVLVLEDGIPLNDPFGSWVYWDRVVKESISGVEVAQEGASSLYGTDALGGVIQFRTRMAKPPGVSLVASYGNQRTPDGSLWAGGQSGNWESTFGGEIFRTDGYIVVPESNRGSVDTAANSEHGTADLMIGRKLGNQNEIFARGWFLDDSRQNGTMLQSNDIRLAQGALGANSQMGRAGTLTLRFYGEAETYHQTFSAVAANRNNETLTDRQTLPAQGVGGSAVWSVALGRRHTLVAGLDGQEKIGHTNDVLFSGATGNHTRNTFSGGHQRAVGAFAEDLIRIAPSWTLALSARFDHWTNFDALSRCIPFSQVCSSSITLFADRTYNSFSPRATLLHQWGSHVSWSASAYRAFRAPTLNELYRSFQQGTVVTNGNPDLRAEWLTGGEAGVDVVGFSRHLELRGVFFLNEIVNPIVNVTLNTSPTLITREKQNLGRTSAPGFEVDALAPITDHWQMSGGYQYVNATVTSFPANPALVGLWVAQVPHHVLTFQARYANPSRGALALTGRLVGKQFDDDQNQFRLGSFFVLDAMASRPIGWGVELFAAAENLLNERYATGFASTGAPAPVPQLGLPITARVGFRVRFPGDSRGRNARPGR